MRSTGSGGGVPGRMADEIRTDGGISANPISGRPQNRSNQISGLLERAIFPFPASRAISHAVMSETKSRLPRAQASGNSLKAGSCKPSLFAIQMTAQVSSRKSDTGVHPSASHGSPTGEVRSTPGETVTVPFSVPEIRKKKSGSALSKLLP